MVYQCLSVTFLSNRYLTMDNISCLPEKSVVLAGGFKDGEVAEVMNEVGVSSHEHNYI